MYQFVKLHPQKRIARKQVCASRVVAWMRFIVVKYLEGPLLGSFNSLVTLREFLRGSFSTAASMTFSLAVE
jgi:hypothetical protein